VVLTAETAPAGESAEITSLNFGTRAAAPLSRVGTATSARALVDVDAMSAMTGWTMANVGDKSGDKTHDSHRLC